MGARGARVGVCALVLLLAVTAAACTSSADEPKTLPSSHPTSSGSGKTSKAGSQTRERDRVLHLYEEFLRHESEIGQAPRNRWRPMLSRYVTDSLAREVITGFDDLRARGREPYGRTRSQPLSLRMSGDEAVMWDCSDERFAGTRNARTGKERLAGVRDTRYKIRFRQQNDSWLISDFTLRGRGC